jgi:hypothetical protein
MLLVGKPENKRLLFRPRRKWVDTIEVDLVEIGWGGVDWTCRMDGAEHGRGY